MATNIVWSDGFFSPGSSPIKVEVSKNDFILYPKNKNGEGWGAPYTKGLGTLSGDKQIKKAGYASSGAMKFSNTPGDLLYGNIDWRRVEDGADTPTYALSYHGPFTRYFPVNSFVYGSEEQHNYIYQKGRVIAIAPYPVLGAALMEHTEATEAGPITKTHLIAICKDGLTDRLYSTTEYGAFDVFSLSPAERKYKVSEKAVADREDSSVIGFWLFIGVIPPQQDGEYTALAARTPWFFNRDGDAAQCIREGLRSWDNGYTIETEEECFLRFKIVFSSPYAYTYTNLYNTDGLRYVCNTNKESLPLQTMIFGAYYYYDIATVNDDISSLTEHVDQPWADTYAETSRRSVSECFAYEDGNEVTQNLDRIVPYGNEAIDHYCMTDTIDQNETVAGDIIVGVDYVGDSEVLIKLEYSIVDRYLRTWRAFVDSLVPTQDRYIFDGEGSPREYNATTVPETWYSSGGATNIRADGNGWGTKCWVDTVDEYRLTQSLWAEAILWYYNKTDCSSDNIPPQDLEPIDVVVAAYLAANDEPPAWFRDGSQRSWVGANSEVKIYWIDPKNNRQEVVLYKKSLNEKPDIFDMPGTGIATSDSELQDIFTYSLYLRSLDIRPSNGPILHGRAKFIHEFYDADYDHSLVDPSKFWYRGVLKSKYYKDFYYTPDMGSLSAANFTYLNKVSEEPEMVVGLGIDIGRVEMLSWPGTPSTNFPTNGIYARNDFSWTVDMFLMGGRSVTKDQYDTMTIGTISSPAPAPSDWSKSSNWGPIGAWPTAKELLSSADNEFNTASMVFVRGSKYVVSLPYITYTGESKCKNYASDVVIEDVFTPAFSLYPLGVF